MRPIHPSGLKPEVVAKVVARRGRVHAFETLTPASTALVVVDLNRGSVASDPACEALVPKVNALAAALRAAGGTVAWVRPEFETTERSIAMFGAETVARFEAQGQGEQRELWPDLGVWPGDLHVLKSGFSAFFPGKSDLDERLTARGITDLLIAGTVTNVCVESSARDAVELGYRVTLVSDACAGHAHGLHEAALTTFYRTFGDVRPAADVIDLINKAHAPE